MKIVYRILNKSWYYLHRYLLKHFGFGCKVRKDVWEREYSNNRWDYLESKDEEGRYHCIIKFYSQLFPQGKILDIGCGTGVLFKYFKQVINLSNEKYTGIDISETAIHQATSQFPGTTFHHLDFDRSDLLEKFDVIIFNETLNYFNFPLKTLQKCATLNLKEKGIIVISMYEGDSHEQIWKQLEKNFTILKHEKIVNEKNQEWNVKVLTPQTVANYEAVSAS